MSLIFVFVVAGAWRRLGDALLWDVSEWNCCAVVESMSLAVDVVQLV